MRVQHYDMYGSDYWQEAEIIQLEEGLLKLKLHRSVTLASLDRLMMYQKYLEGMVERSTQYREINDLMLRL
jgi:hypothetical protein